MGASVKACLAVTLGLCYVAGLIHGAPTRARYMWVKCRPDEKNSNCVTQKGPWLVVSTPPQSETSTPEGSGSEPEDVSGSPTLQYRAADITETGSGSEESGSGSQVDYSDYIHTQKVGGDTLPAESELKEDSLIP